PEGMPQFVSQPGNPPFHFLLLGVLPDKPKEVVFRQDGHSAAALSLVSRSIRVDHPHVFRVSVLRSDQSLGFGKTVVETPVVLLVAVGMAVEPLGILVG